MTQDKMRRVITACVAAATVLLTCLSIFITYQWITIAVLNNREKALNEDIKKYEQSIAEGGEQLEYYESDLYKNYAYWQLKMLEDEK